MGHFSEGVYVLYCYAYQIVYFHQVSCFYHDLHDSCLSCPLSTPLIKSHLSSPLSRAMKWPCVCCSLQMIFLHFDQCFRLLLSILQPKNFRTQKNAVVFWSLSKKVISIHHPQSYEFSKVETIFRFTKEITELNYANKST